MAETTKTEALSSKAADDTREEDTPALRLMRMIDELFADVPQEELDRLPTDGALNLDHYLYGAPKK